jgi:hypothetical protein
VQRDRRKRIAREKGRIHRYWLVERLLSSKEEETGSLKEKRDY